MKDNLARLLILISYFMVFFVALDFFKYSILTVASVVSTASIVTAIIKAVICAKFLIISQHILPIRVDSKSPLILHILRRSFLHVVIVVILIALEETIVATYHHHNILYSITGLKVGSGMLFLSLICLYWIMVIPYTMFSAINTLLGKNKLKKIFLSKTPNELI